MFEAEKKGTGELQDNCNEENPPKIVEMPFNSFEVIEQN